MAKNVLFYVSGHGFGHSTRQMEVIRQILQRKQEDIKVIVKTTAPASLFSAEHTYLEYIRCDTDVGVMQKDSVTCDLTSTLERLGEFWDNEQAWIERETAFAEQNDVGVIVSDICPLPFNVSSNMGITGIGISNFSWDWIYAAYTDSEPGFLPYIEKLKKSYSLCTILCRLPFYGDLSVFPRIWDIPCIARKSPFSKKQVKKQLGMEQYNKVILFSFGGFGLSSLPVDKLLCMDEYFFITTGKKSFKGKNIACFSDEELRRKGIAFPDIVRGADAVVSKLGYGIVSECVANETPMLAGYRDDFRESKIFCEHLGEFIPFVLLEKEQLVSAQWEEGLSTLFEQDGKFRKLPVHGAEVAAQIVLKALDEKLDIGEESRFFNVVLKNPVPE